MTPVIFIKKSAPNYSVYRDGHIAEYIDKSGNYIHGVPISLLSIPIPLVPIIWYYNG